MIQRDLGDGSYASYDEYMYPLVRDRQCVGCGQTFIPDATDDQNQCWECENGVEYCTRGTAGCSVSHTHDMREHCEQ